MTGLASSTPAEPPPGAAASGSIPGVSVGLPVYNGARFIAEAIDSILGQSFAELELIISDNASTDSTQEICERYARSDRRVLYFRQPVNLGAPRNWNFVADKARGRYFKWASANDFVDREFIAKTSDVLESDEGTVLCYGRTWIVDESTDERQLYDGDMAVTDDRPSARFIRVCRMFRLNNALSGLFRLDMLRRTRLNQVYPASDIPLLAEMALLGRFRMLADPLLYRRIGQHSFSSLLSTAKLQELFDPQKVGGCDFRELHRQTDCFRAVVRTPMAPMEKLRSFAAVAHQAYWARRELAAELRTLLPRPLRSD
jgi:glycosyltransferase involved in cell wall biosynthesis